MTTQGDRLTSTKQMTPGQLYCLFTVEGFGDEQYDASGALVWFCADGHLYSAEGNYDGDPIQCDWDYAVAQTGSFNPEFAVPA